jgi:glucose dehydrogenase
MTGKEVWTMKLEASVNAGVISWRGRSGRQYITAVAAGGANGAPANDAIVTFALPK